MLKTASGDAYTTALLTGGLVLFVSVKGLVGAVTGSRRLLLVYFCFLLLLSCIILYAAVISYCYADYADEVADSYWEKLHEAAKKDTTLPNREEIEAGERYLRANLRSASLVCRLGVGLGSGLGLASHAGDPGPCGPYRFSHPDPAPGRQRNFRLADLCNVVLIQGVLHRFFTMFRTFLTRTSSQGDGT